MVAKKYSSFVSKIDLFESVKLKVYACMETMQLKSVQWRVTEIEHSY